MKSAIIDFNKSSDKYHISVKTYGQDDWESGLTQFNADVASGSGPDLVDFSNLNYTLYAEKGVFEDLYPYMEKSGLKKGFHFFYSGKLKIRKMLHQGFGGSFCVFIFGQLFFGIDNPHGGTGHHHLGHMTVGAAQKQIQ